jgi:hypothetical protein
MLHNQCIYVVSLHVTVLGKLAKLRKATMSVCPSVLSVRIKQLGSNWTDFYEN